MRGEGIQESRLSALKLRLACYSYACENGSLARLAAHTWRHLWFFSGHPNFRTGTLCYRHTWGPRGIRIVCKANLDGPGFCAILTCQAGIDELKGTFDSASDVKKSPNTLAMECILCGDHDRLNGLDVALLEEEVFSGQNAVNAFQYAAALGGLDCFTVLMDNLGVTSPLLVGSDGKLTSGVLACCGARFPFGDREGLLHLLLSRLSWDSFRPEPLLESASVFAAPWMLSFVFSRFAEAEKKGTTAAVYLGPFLGTACGEGHLDCARLLLEHGADANASDQAGRTALIAASLNGHTDCVRLLLEHGADANASDWGRWTPLIWACRNGHTDCVRLLLEHGADANASNQAGGTALIWACRNGRTDCVRLLLEHGADANASDLAGRTALIWACRNGHTGCVRLLLEHGADANASDQVGDTALVWASENGHTDCARLLLEHGADANASNQAGRTALIWACRNGHTDCARLLLEHGADANASDQAGWTALMAASFDGRTDCARLLLVHRADVHASDPGDWTALMSASQNGPDWADVNAKSNAGSTPLLMASLFGHTDCARLLLEHGADANAKNQRGETPLLKASQNGHTDVVRLLKDHGAS